MKPIVYFIHGFDSSLNSSKFTAIHQGSFNRVGINLPWGVNSSRRGIEESVFRLARDIADEMKIAADEGCEDVVFFGHSFGGYWARYFGMIYSRPSVLVNPSLFHPMQPKFIPEDVDISSPNLATRHYYIELGDEIVNQHEAMDFYRDDGMVSVNNVGHHRVKNLGMINTMLNQAVETYRNAIIQGISDTGKVC